MKRGQVGGTHYEDMLIDPWAIIDSWEQCDLYYKGNVLKYILRMGKKGPALEDAKKALHYCQKLVEVCEKNSKV